MDSTAASVAAEPVWDMTSVAKEYRQCRITRPPEPLTGIDNWVDGWMGRYRRRAASVQELRREAEAIDGRDEDCKFLSDPALQRRLLELREKFRRRDEASEACLHEAL